MPHKLRDNNFAVQVCTQDIAKHRHRPAGIQLCIALANYNLYKKKICTIGRLCRKAHSTSSGASKLTGQFFETFLRYQQSIHFVYCMLYLPPRSGHKLNFFLFPFFVKIIYCLESKSMTPSQEKLFSSAPPSNSLVSVSDP